YRMLRLVTRPLLIIFLTIFVNLVGFGIIIPLLPFYAETFGASPVVIGLLFAIFSLCQLAAAPALGDLSDRYGRRPVLVFSLAGTVVSFVMLALAHSVAMLFAARIVDGLSGGNLSTARGIGQSVPVPAGAAAAPTRPPRAGHRLRVLVRVRDVPDDVRAVRRAALRIRRRADRLLLRGVRHPRRRRAGRMHSAGGPAA